MPASNQIAGVTRNKNKANYGIDAPQMGIMLVIVLLLVTIVSIWLHSSKNAVAQGISSIGFSLAPTGLLVLLLIIFYIKIEKFRHRDKMLNLLTWKGDEKVLDIGTGKGLLMIGAAKRLTTGKSYGIDIWNRADLSNNSFEAAMQNAELEGVKDKVEIINANVMKMPFPNNSFDYVLSNLCIHNIKSKTSRAIAIHEIVRVLKPGGTALIADFMHTAEYEKEFSKQGLDANVRFSFLIAPVLLWIVTAKKAE